LSRRNNDERLGAPHPDAPTPTTPDTSDLFAFVNPTEFVELPSQGVYYPEGHPLHNQTVIEIKHMTAKEEDILTSEALLKNELAVDRLLESVIINPAVKVGDLLLGDKNAILIASRVTGFGPFYDVEAACPSCKRSSAYTFDLTELKPRTVDLPDTVTDEGGGIFSFELPVSQVRIYVRLLTSRDEKKIANLLINKNGKGASNPVTGLLKSIVVQANEHTALPTVHQFVEMMPLPDVKHLRTTYEGLKPDLDLRFDFICPLCNEEGKVGMPMTAAFFWPNT
tara:strand:+ start:912 stop:1754 length:843 start_codon:yes stop_codon:yes gene_type:complete